MKREILVEIWLKLAGGDCKEVKNQKRVLGIRVVPKKGKHA